MITERTTCCFGFDYLMALEQHAEAVAKAPTCWFPWNHRQAIEAANST